MAGRTASWRQAERSQVPWSHRSPKVQRGRPLTAALTPEERLARTARPFQLVRSCNNFFKAALLHRACSSAQVLSAVDLACGRGADILKWVATGVPTVLFLDASVANLEETGRRLSLLPPGKLTAERRLFDFTVAAMEERGLEDSERRQAGFALHDVVSCHFAFQFAFGTPESSQHAIANVKRLLRSGGLFLVTLPDGEALAKRQGGGSHRALATFSDMGDDGLAAVVEPLVFREPFVQEMTGAGFELLESGKPLAYLREKLVTDSYVRSLQKVFQIPEQLAPAEEDLLNCYTFYVFRHV